MELLCYVCKKKFLLQICQKGTRVSAHKNWSAIFESATWRNKDTDLLLQTPVSLPLYRFSILWGDTCRTTYEICKKDLEKNIQNYFLKKIKKVLTILKVFFFFFWEITYLYELHCWENANIYNFFIFLFLKTKQC